METALDRLEELRRRADGVKLMDTLDVHGRVCRVAGTLVESHGPRCSLGDLCEIEVPGQAPVLAEVVGLKGSQLQLMPLNGLAGVALDRPVRRLSDRLRSGFSPELLGRVIDGLGQPLDGRPLPENLRPLLLDAPPPRALERHEIHEPFTTGVRAIDGLLTMGLGQRVGLFAGSGVGKSTLLGMISRNSSADVNVIALIGERGREVRDFLDKTLGPEGIQRSVIVAATSDEAPMARIRAAMLATAIAEQFRDEGKNVLLVMDSVTRVAMAQREIGLAIGEPPATKGYTPSVFALLPRLLERAGRTEKGSITAIYTVLVEGDDMNEPVADTVRGILDGHFVMTRALAQRNHYPALDVLQSVSRLMSELADPDHKVWAGQMRRAMALCAESKDLVSLGAYQAGHNAELDLALSREPAFNLFLQQPVGEPTDFPTTRAALARIMLAGCEPADFGGSPV